MSSEPATALNLTAIAERLPHPPGPQRAVCILEQRTRGLVFEVRAWNGVDDWPEEQGDYDAIYVIISGEGVLRCGGEALECAVGDVLFASAGPRRCFERMSRGFSTWRILLGPSCTVDSSSGSGT
jgi:mannose-6-phosphate isomerase-like protein (cupin superfamily)